MWRKLGNKNSLMPLSKRLCIIRIRVSFYALDRLVLGLNCNNEEQEYI